jgi:hypothetical protein
MRIFILANGLAYVQPDSGEDWTEPLLTIRQAQAAYNELADEVQRQWAQERRERER